MVGIIPAADLIEALEHSPDWWGGDKDSKHNAIFVIPPATAAKVCSLVGEGKPKYESVAYYGNVILRTTSIKTFSHIRWSKIVENKACLQLDNHSEREHGTEVRGACQGELIMNPKVYEYDAVIKESEVGKGGAFVPFPYDVRAEFSKGRVKVHATFDGEPYDGSIVNMGVKNADGSVCYIIGILKDIRAKIGKQPGDNVHVSVTERR